MASEDGRRRYPRLSEACLPVATAVVQVFAELFTVHVDRYTKARRFEGRSHGGVADTPLQPLLEGRVRPGKVKRNVWNA